MSDGPQIHIDDDWKAQAQAEKQRLAEEAKAKQPAAPATPPPPPTASAATAPRASESDADETDGENPPTDFKTLVSSIASQAMLYLGMMPDPVSGQRIVGFEHARQQMDLLGVLEEKTQGNLSDEENTMLASMIHRLQKQYVQVVMQMRPIPDNG